MTTNKFRDWLKPQIDIGQGITTGKLDTSKEKTVCIYNDTSEGSPVTAIGGAESYNVRSMKILTHWGQNSNTAELHALSIYDVLKQERFFIEEKWHFIQLLCPEPIPMGTDEKGFYEFVIKLQIYYER